MDRLNAPGLSIEYRGDPSLPYGDTAARTAEPFKFVIFHYTGISVPFRDLVEYTLRVDEARGGQFGYHFVIDSDGTTVQTAPLTKRTNHIRTNPEIGASNSNAIGISLHMVREEPTAAQLEAATALTLVLSKTLNIRPPNHFGHGEINAHKDPNEGITLARRFRGSPRIRW
jgi:N-acetyl-anhydromuramyl-L-alanine amidase AmpD